MQEYYFPSRSESAFSFGLPNPLLSPDGEKITDTTQWPGQRDFLVAMLDHYLYGCMPARKDPVFVSDICETISDDNTMKITKSVLHCGIDAQIKFDLRMVSPNTSSRKFPVIVRNHEEMYDEIRFDEQMAVEADFALITFDRTQIARDMPGKTDPVFSMYPEADWGILAVWAWVHMRIADALSFFPDCDGEKICYTGHSRGGKAAACAAIHDERVRVVVPNGSGCGGLGCFRFLGGYGSLRQNTQESESLGFMNHHFPDWCNSRSKDFCADKAPFSVEKEFYLPLDLHFVRAAMAPRAILGTEADHDDWANPTGSYLTWKAAMEVFDLLECPQHNRLVYRTGGHDHNHEDWVALLDFCNEIFRR